MKSRKLKNAPLQEVIFEIYWKLPLDASGIPTDPGFDLAQGIFASKIKKDFPVKKRLVPHLLNFRIYPLLVYQFRKGELAWPLVQLGPGLMTVNDTEKNYFWEKNFQSNIKKAVEVLQKSYDAGLEIERVKLQYIDAVEFDSEKQTAADFVSTNMKIELKNHYPLLGKPKDLNIVQTFDLEQDTTLQLVIQNGIYNKTGNPAIIWTTAVEKMGGLDFSQLFSWLEFGHAKVSETFVNMLTPEFYASFSQ